MNHMAKGAKTYITSPRLKKGAARLLAGLVQTYTADTLTKIPELWKQFGELADQIPDQTGNVAYGVCAVQEDGAIKYMAGIEVTAEEDHSGLTYINLPAQTYAIFTHLGHVSEIASTWQYIWTSGLKDAGLEPIQAPQLEVYPLEFDPHAASAQVELWVPVRA